MKFLQFALAVVLFSCLFDKPNNFYMYVHGVSSVLFGLMAYNMYETDKKNWTFIFILLALLIQPFLPLPLERNQWNYIEAGLSIILIIRAFTPEKL